MKKLLITAATAAGLLGAGLFFSPVSAYNGTDCTYTTTSEATPNTVDPAVDPLLATIDSTVGVQAGFGGMAPGAVEVGACVNVPTGTAPGVFEGGAVGVGAGLNPSPTNHLCGSVPGVATVGTTYAAPVGIYAVADGDNANLPAAQLGGYVALSNYESGNTEGPGNVTMIGSSTSCENAAGSNTNSGGSVGVTAVGVYAPVPFVACGNNDSGQNWSTTNRDGCYVDTTG